MTNERIAPASWTKAGRGFADAAEGFRGAASGALGGMSVDQLGCNNGGTLADTAFAIVVPSMFEALQETVDGISEGLSIEGAGLSRTGKAYADVEIANTHIAKEMM
ncbi:hypothetical protein GCM10027418_23840 [Mariniluteicoccus endophyticus]